MRLLVSSLINLVLLLLAALRTPFRLLGTRQRPAYIYFRLKGDPPYRRSLRRRLGLFRGRPEPATVTSLEALRHELEVVSKDPAVRGVLFDVEGITTPGTKRLAIAKLFDIPRKAGKEVVAYAVTASTEEYALLCCADRFLMPAAGRLELTGFAAEATALGTGLKRLGVSAHFVRRGDHKTAPELFTHDTVSEIQRKTIETFLDERYEELIELIARGRKMSLEEARARVDAGPYSARRAVAQGLCDAICSEAELPAFLAGKLPADGDTKGDKDAKSGKKSGEEKDSDRTKQLAGFHTYSSRLPFPSVRWRPVRAAPRLGLIKVEGIIAQGEGGSGAGMQVAGSEAIIKALRSARRAPRCAAVLLYVDSPGGSATASEIVLEEVKRLAKKKRVVAYFDRVAASGGYQIALGADEIWAGEHAIAGSIGVFAGKFDLSTLLERLGIHREIVTRGANAGIYSTSRGFTENERRSLESEVEEIYQVFLEHVANSRKMSKEEVHRRAEGRIYSGVVAKTQRLVDGTCDFEAACRRALELAGKPSERFQLTPFSTSRRRFSVLGAFSQLSRAQVYALMWPWIRLPL